MDMFSYLMEQYPWLFYAGGGITFTATCYAAYVKLTPSKDDDKAWAEFMKKSWVQAIMKYSGMASKPPAKRRKKK